MLVTLAGTVNVKLPAVEKVWDPPDDEEPAPPPEELLELFEQARAAMAMKVNVRSQPDIVLLIFRDYKNFGTGVPGTIGFPGKERGPREFWDFRASTGKRALCKASHKK